MIKNKKFEKITTKQKIKYLDFIWVKLKIPEEPDEIVLFPIFALAVFIVSIIMIPLFLIYLILVTQTMRTEIKTKVNFRCPACKGIMGRGEYNSIKCPECEYYYYLK